MKTTISIFISILILTSAIFVYQKKDTSVNLWTSVSTRAQKVKRTSGAFESLDYWNMQRAYPNQTIPDTGYYQAYEYSKQNIPSETDNTLTDPWQQLGPHNVGGRTISLAINPLRPSTVFAGAASGGLWRSYTGGSGTNSWINIQTGFPVLGVSSIAIHPSDTNIIYIGTGEAYSYSSSIGGLTIRETRGSYGIGILKTTNYGASWVKALDWSYNQRRGVWAVKMNPLNANVLWAATTEGTYRSYNAGLNWTQVHSVIMGMDLVINPSDTNKILISYGNLSSTGHGIYRSTNGGASFTQITSGLPASFGGKAVFHVYKTSPNTVFLSIGNGTASGAGTWLCKSTNFGESWSIVSTNDYSTYQGWFAHFVVVHELDAEKVLTAGVDVWKSTNGGVSQTRKSDWAAWYFGRTPIGGPEGPPNYSHADHHTFVIHPTNPDIIYLGNDGGVFRTTNFGETFEGLNGGYQSTQFYNGFSCASLDSLYSIGGMQDNATAIWDGQLAWIRVIGGDGTWTAINFQNNNIVYGTSQYLALRRSTNKGASFSSLSVPSGGTTGFVAPYAVAPSNSQIMYAGKTTVFKSVNGGSSWTATNGGSPPDNNPALSMAISYTNPDVAYYGSAPVNSIAKIFATTNGGTNWNNVTGSLPDRYPVDIAVDPTSDATVYVVFSGFGSPHLYKSVNYGASWTNIGTSLPDVPSSAVIIDPAYPNHIYFGNDLGVYVSTNGGTNWESYNTGLPNASIIMDLSLSPLNRKLRIATHGNGVYERDLVGSVIGIKPISEIASEYRLYQNYPNPFNPITKIRFDIKANIRGEKTNVKLILYDVRGSEIVTVVNEQFTPGTYEVDFDGSKLSSGIYFYTIVTDNFTDTKKMILLK